MLNYSLPHTCLSTDKHDKRVLDVTLHYFGCLRVSERQIFYDGLPEKSRGRIRREEQRIDQVRSRLEFQPETKTGAILNEFKESMNEWRSVNGKGSFDARRKLIPPYDLDDGIDTEIKAPVIFFKNSRPYDIPGVENTFPNQKIAIKDLLADKEDTNPLMQPGDDSMIRYFHLPANNMIWVEEAIARYYHEKRPDADELSPKSKLQRTRTKTETILRPEFWRGQQHFDDHSEVHARHMRPFCDAISLGPISTEPLPKNLVLFMPYLHWETDRGRMRSADTIKEACKVKLSSMAEVVDKATVIRDHSTHPDRHSRVRNDFNQPQLSARPLVAAPRAQRMRILGKVLRSAAALLEAIDFRLDDKLIYEYLHQRPPLHPRRTLDQSYYGALKNTGTRDRDQVVYRATTPEPHDCLERMDNKDGKCRQCHEDIRKVPRLIMVDQLWMWILDEKTVITSFPRRWAKNKPDPSAVHKSLRMRLRSAQGDEIRSAFDLALIIVDECSRVFFDRTKATDRQPNLVDIFAEAISGVAYKKTAAFDQFLTYTHLASNEYKSRDKFQKSTSQNTLLNINPEGKLLKEIKDIIDEIHILTRINQQQQTVAETFVKHIKQSLLPKLRSRSPWDPVAALYENGNDTGLQSLQMEQREATSWTLARANHLLKDIQDRISELNTLQENAKNTSAALKDLLTLKQQQAGVIEAREAVEQAKETLKQGRSIMLFTVVTMVFLPLSFCASIFGMNTREFNNGLLTLSQEFSYMFPISLAAIATSLVLAFSRSTFLSAFGSLLWNAICLPLNVALTWVLVKTGLYALSRELAVLANSLKGRERKKTGTMKANVMREKVNLGKVIYRSRDCQETPRLGVYPDDDVEGGQASGSQVCIVR